MAEKQESYKKQFEDKVSFDHEPTREEFVAAVKGAIQSRSALTWFVWKTLQEEHPEIDATEVMGKAYRAFGRWYGEKWGEVEDAGEALCAQSSKTGYAVFQQQLSQISEDYAQKDFSFCPHMEMFEKLGATAKERQTLCQDILSEGDYGNLDVHPGLTLEFKTQIGAGADHCEYCVSKCPAAKDGE